MPFIAQVPGDGFARTQAFLPGTQRGEFVGAWKPSELVGLGSGRLRGWTFHELQFIDKIKLLR